MRLVKLLGALILIVACFTVKLYGQDFDKLKFQHKIQEGIKRAYASSVKIWGIDTLTQKQNSAQFTGVVVDASGHILTAAHAISPGKMYRVVFPDGKEYLGRGLGKMAFEPKTGRPDAAMIQILGKESWPFAEMGWSYSLKVNEPCISIAYPTTLNQPLPTIRVGYISAPLERWGFIESTCKMEPGDSGGPLFDYLGRVIGIHSRIDIKENINYEIPVDTYRKYWSSLTLVNEYSAFPTQEDSVLTDPLEKELTSFVALQDLKSEFAGLEKALKANALTVNSSIKGRRNAVNGTLFNWDSKQVGFNKKGKSFIISKSSMVGDSITVNVAGKIINVKVVARSHNDDLVLLQPVEELKQGIKISSIKSPQNIDKADLGEFLISVLPDAPSEISVLGSSLFDISKKFSTGYFGASANFIDQKIILTRINPNSPAEKSGLALNDQITGINNVPIAQPPQYGSELMKYEPGDTISIQGIRNNMAYNLSVTLGNLPQTSGHPAYHFAGGRSARSDGFRQVFAHDGILKPEQCGGPVFDLNGNFIGINIARFSRTSCLGIPGTGIYEFIEQYYLTQKTR